MKTPPAPTIETPDTGSTDPDPVSIPADPPPAARKPGRPRKTAAPAAAPAPGRPSNKDKLGKQLAEQYAMLGMFLLMVAPNAGRATLEQADSCGAALAAWADTNPRVRKLLERTLSGAGAAAVLAAHLPIVVAALADVKGGKEGSPLAGMAAMFGGATTP